MGGFQDIGNGHGNMWWFFDLKLKRRRGDYRDETRPCNMWWLVHELHHGHGVGYSSSFLSEVNSIRVEKKNHDLRNGRGICGGCEFLKTRGA